jgi:hypothetical protein
VALSNISCLITYTYILCLVTGHVTLALSGVKNDRSFSNPKFQTRP